MAYTEQNLGSGSITTTTAVNALTVGSGRNVVIYSISITNTSSAVVTLTMNISDGTDRLFAIKKIPAGSGKCVNIDQAQLMTLGQTQVVSFQIDTGSINYKINGAVRT